jgi:hypothetical protein
MVLVLIICSGYNMLRACREVKMKVELNIDRGALIAPPEHDLFAFAGDDRFVSLFLPNYERELGPVSLDSNVFGFYFYRRNPEDLTHWTV